MLRVDTTFQFLQLTLHTLNLILLSLERFEFIEYFIVVFNIISILFNSLIRIGQSFDMMIDHFTCLLHFILHQQSQLILISFKFIFQVPCDVIGNLTSINVQASFWNIFNLSFNLSVPLCEKLNFLFYFSKSYFSLLPFWHLESWQKSKNLSNFFVVIFNVICWNIEILLNFVHHLVSKIIVLNRL